MRASCRALVSAILMTAFCTGCQEASDDAHPASGDRDAGRIALQAYDCGVCHRIPGVRGAKGLVGPPLDGFGTRIYIAGRFPNGEQTLMRWIMDAPRLEPLTAMPAVGVAEKDARDMAAYLLSLR